MAGPSFCPPQRHPCAQAKALSYRTHILPSATGQDMRTFWPEAELSYELVDVPDDQIDDLVLANQDVAIPSGQLAPTATVGCEEIEFITLPTEKPDSITHSLHQGIHGFGTLVLDLLAQLCQLRIERPRLVGKLRQRQRTSDLKTVLASETSLHQFRNLSSPPCSAPRIARVPAWWTHQ